MRVFRLKDFFILLWPNCVVKRCKLHAIFVTTIIACYYRGTFLRGLSQTNLQRNIVKCIFKLLIIFSWNFKIIKSVLGAADFLWLVECHKNHQYNSYHNLRIFLKILILKKAKDKMNARNLQKYKISNVSLR